MTVTTTPSSAAPQPLGAPPVVQSTTEADHREGEQLVEADLLVEDVSIDGMCGVY